MAISKISLLSMVLFVGLVGCSQAEQPASQSGNQIGGTTSNTTPPSTTQPQANNQVQAPANSTPETKKQTVDLFFPDDQLLKLYREKQDVSYQETKELPKKALEAWIKGAKAEKLTSILPADVKVEYVKDLGNKRAEVSFSKEIRKANFGSSGEDMLTKAVPLILQQFGYQEVTILVEGKADETVLRHTGANKPFKADDPAKYEYVK